MIQLYEHQRRALEETEGQNRVAYYHDMGLGKTFTGSEKLIQLGERVNLVICQKSKINDWMEHFQMYYQVFLYDLTDRHDYFRYVHYNPEYYDGIIIGFINYELVFRRPELKDIPIGTLMLDESSMIQNETAKRSKFIMQMNAQNAILLSGTPTSGKYENLWSQLHLLGWNISKKLYWQQYIDTDILWNQGFPIKVVKGYKNVDRLKEKLREHGAHFLKTDEVFDLPQQNFSTISVPASKEYKKFRRSGIVTVDSTELVGDTTLTQILYERQLCGQYNKAKLEAFKNLVESTSDRLIVFYNFTDELTLMLDVVSGVCDRTFSIVNGSTKDLRTYEECDDSITFIQYQAGAMGLNLQKANKIIYFTPPLSSELFEQSKKRIHRIGQDRPCFYYLLTVSGSIEEKIYQTLEMRRDFTDALFQEMEEIVK